MWVLPVYLMVSLPCHQGGTELQKKFIMKICQSLPVGLHPAFPQGSSSRWLWAYHSPNPASIWLPSARSPAVGQHTGSCILGLLQLTARKAAASSRAKCPYSGDLKTHVPQIKQRLERCKECSDLHPQTLSLQV